MAHAADRSARGLRSVARGARSWGPPFPPARTDGRGTTSMGSPSESPDPPFWDEGGWDSHRTVRLSEDRSAGREPWGYRRLVLAWISEKPLTAARCIPELGRTRSRRSRHRLQPFISTCSLSCEKGQKCLGLPSILQSKYYKIFFIFWVAERAARRGGESNDQAGDRGTREGPEGRLPDVPGSQGAGPPGGGGPSQRSR